MNEIRNKRFIAGAVCPQCGAMDKIYTYSRGDEVFRACAACNFSESMSDSLAQRNVEELPTRVNQQRLGEKPLAHETPIEKVRLLDPKND